MAKLRRNRRVSAHVHACSPRSGVVVQRRPLAGPAALLLGPIAPDVSGRSLFLLAPLLSTMVRFSGEDDDAAGMAAGDPVADAYYFDTNGDFQELGKERKRTPKFDTVPSNVWWIAGSTVRTQSTSWRRESRSWSQRLSGCRFQCGSLVFGVTRASAYVSQLSLSLSKPRCSHEAIAARSSLSLGEPSNARW